MADVNPEHKHSIKAFSAALRAFGIYGPKKAGALRQSGKRTLALTSVGRKK